MWVKVKKNGRIAYEMLKAAGKEYGEDRVGRMAAAVAYRAIFALAPLFLVAVFVFGLFLGGSASAETQILDAVEQFAGSEVRDAVSTFLGSVETGGNTAGVIGFALLLWTSSSLFNELQNDLNDIFHVPYEKTTGVVAFVTKRGLGFLSALGLGLVLVSVWLLNSIWQLLEGLFTDNLEPLHDLISLLAPLVSIIVLPVVMALAFQVLSRVKVRWRAVWWGAIFTSVAFLAAAYGTGLYFSQSGTSVATAAGSIFVVLLLAYVLSAVYLFGAEVTKVYNDYLESGDVTRPNVRQATHEVPEVVVAEPREPVPLAAIGAFLSGLFVGWWRRR